MIRDTTQIECVSGFRISRKFKILVKIQYIRPVGEKTTYIKSSTKRKYRTQLTMMNISILSYPVLLSVESRLNKR